MPKRIPAATDRARASTPRAVSFLPRALVPRADFFRGLHYTPPAIVRAAPAYVEPLKLRVVLAGALVLIVVRELGARLDAAQGMDEDLLSSDDSFAIRRARVIDQARVAAARIQGSVDDGVPVEREEESVMPLHLRIVVAP